MAIRVSDTFKVHVAKSHAFSKYTGGPVAFVTNGFSNNGVQGYVKPLPRDRVFGFEGICISGFCEATVQEPPFVGRGNGGSGVLALEPLRRMETKQLFAWAAYFNKYVKWRFSYGRMVSRARMLRIEVTEIPRISRDFDMKVSLPPCQKTHRKTLRLCYARFELQRIFHLHSGDYHNASVLPEGKIPLVSCGGKNNGVVKFVKVPKEKVYKNCLTIAYNGQPMTAKYHPYDFAAKDDVAVCIPKNRVKLSTLIFIQFMLNRERWRFSYGRKCFREKLSQMSIDLPVDKTVELDENGMEGMLENTSYWDYLKRVYRRGVDLSSDIAE